MAKPSFYITAAIPYVNAKPHIGHALEFVQTDVVARYHRLLDKDVLALSGGDENALKNVQAAEKAGEPIKEFVDKNNELFHQLAKKLDVQFDVWQKGSDREHHFPSSQKLWELCQKNGDIYKKTYKGLYCIGCEVFYSREELDENGECYEHPGKKLEEVEEENYFFRLSKYQQDLLRIIEDDRYQIIPEFRKNEVLAFLKGGLRDISISRTNERAKNWGVPVPGDPTQKIYVWFDALNIYQSGIGFGWNEKLYQKWWPADVHVIGKGIIRFHAIYWPAFLLSAGLPLPKKLYVHGYYTVNGQKISKTVGNVLDPLPLIERYGTDALRYYFLAKTPPFEDGDFSEEKLKNAYNADLANELGNLVARVAKLCETSGYEFPSHNAGLDKNIEKKLRIFRFDEAIDLLWEKLRRADRLIEQERPWEQSGKPLREVLEKLVLQVRLAGYNLQPFLPGTAGKIAKQFAGPTIRSSAPLFPRIT
jgi:methionyl-tRNA synthetase